MSDRHAPIVPHIFTIGSQKKPYEAAPITRYQALYHTQLTVRGQPPGGKLETIQQNNAYCLQDDAAWIQVQASHTVLCNALAALGDELRRLGSYRKRLKEAGGNKQAPNPLSPTVISASDPDNPLDWWYDALAVPRVERITIERHTPEMLREAGKDYTGRNQKDHTVCPSDADWERVELLHQTATEAQKAWKALLTELGTYKDALADGRYQKGTAMPTVRKVAAPALPELPAELAGWRWSTNPKNGHYFLMHPKSPATYATRHYPDPDRAIAEARRYVLSQPKPKPIEQEPTVQAIDAAVRSGDVTALPVLSTTEQQDLDRYEATIERGLQTFIEVGEALAHIRDGRLYRAQYGTFEDYCREKWGIGASRARQLIGASEIAGEIKSVTTVTPANEAQVRPLAGLSPDQQRQAWQQAVETSGGKPTAKDVQQAVEVVKPRPAETPSADDFTDVQGRWAALGYRLYDGGNGRYTLFPPGERPGIANMQWHAVLARLEAQEAKQGEAAPFWQALTPAHPTAHLWTRERPDLWRAACGMVTQNRAPSGSTEGGHCSSCVRATWAEKAKEAPASTPPAPDIRQAAHALGLLIEERDGGVLLYWPGEKPDLYDTQPIAVAWEWLKDQAPRDLIERAEKAGWELGEHQRAGQRMYACLRRADGRETSEYADMLLAYGEAMRITCAELPPLDRELSRRLIALGGAHTPARIAPDGAIEYEVIPPKGRALPDYFRGTTDAIAELVGKWETEHPPMPEDLYAAGFRWFKPGAGQLAIHGPDGWQGDAPSAQMMIALAHDRLATAQAAAPPAGGTKLMQLCHNLIGAASDRDVAWNLWKRIGRVLAGTDSRMLAIQGLQLIEGPMRTIQTDQIEDLSIAIANLNECEEGTEGEHWIKVGWALLDMEADDGQAVPTIESEVSA